MSYKVELRYLSGWDDAGWNDADESGERPTRFADRESAGNALADFFRDVKAAVAGGAMDVEESSDDYRIVEVAA